MTDPVQTAVSTIRENLTESWRDWDVSRGDLLENNRTLEGLTPAQRNEVIGQLSDGDLGKWADEINGSLGSLDASEREALFRSLADGLDAGQLARVTRAFDGHDGSIGELGSAIATNAPASVRADYVREMASATNSGDKLQGDVGFGSSTVTDGDPEARAVGTVLASLGNSPAEFDRAIAALNDDQLESVMETAAGGSLSTFASPGGAGATTTVDYDPRALAAIVNAAAGSGDASTKARVFAAAGEQLGEIKDAGGLLTPYVGQTDDIRVATDAMTNLLRTDPNGITTQLRTGANPSGASMVAYTAGLMETGQTEVARDLIVRLQQGNDGTGNASQNFTDPVVARNLGYFTGATAAAINDVTSDRQDQANLLKNIFGAGFGAAGAANPVAGVIASVGNGITAQTIDSITSDVADGDKALKQAIFELGIPRDTSGRIDDRGTGYTDYNAAFAAVAEANR